MDRWEEKNSNLSNCPPIKHPWMNSVIIFLKKNWFHYCGERLGKVLTCMLIKSCLINWIVTSCVLSSCSAWPNLGHTLGMRTTHNPHVSFDDEIARGKLQTPKHPPADDSNYFSNEVVKLACGKN